MVSMGLGGMPHSIPCASMLSHPPTTVVRLLKEGSDWDTQSVCDPHEGDGTGVDLAVFDARNSHVLHIAQPGEFTQPKLSRRSGGFDTFSQPNQMRVVLSAGRAWTDHSTPRIQDCRLQNLDSLTDAIRLRRRDNGGSLQAGRRASARQSRRCCDKSPSGPESVADRADITAMPLNEHNPAEALHPPLEPLLTPREVANYLKKSEKTLANWRCAKVGPTSIRVGGDVRYRVDDLLAWVDANASFHGVV